MDYKEELENFIDQITEDADTKKEIWKFVYEFTKEYLKGDE